LSSTEDRPIFEDLKGSRPRPRTSKIVLEAATSVYPHLYDSIRPTLGSKFAVMQTIIWQTICAAL